MNVSILNAVKQQLLKKQCKVHRKKAEASIVGSELRLKTCCGAFHSEIKEFINPTIERETKKQVDQQLSKVFKNKI